MPCFIIICMYMDTIASRAEQGLRSANPAWFDFGGVPIVFVFLHKKVAVPSVSEEQRGREKIASEKKTQPKTYEIAILPKSLPSSDVGLHLCRQNR